MCYIHEVLKKNLLEQMEEKNLSAEWLALEAEISKSFLSEILSDKKKASLETVGKLATALKVRYSDLFAHTEHPDCILRKKQDSDR